MVGFKSVLGATVVTFSATTQATVLFHNDGNLQGWDYIRKEHKGTVDQVSNVVYKGNSAIKVTQTFDPNYHDRYHSEVDHNDGYRNGDTRFYGFVVRLSDNWDFTSQGYNLAQFISHRSGGDNCGDDWMPSTMVWITGKQLHTRIVNGVYRGNNCRRDIIPFDNLGQLQPGKWHKIIIQAHWADNNSGYLKLWLDGKKVLEKYNIATTVSGNDQFQFRVGLHCPISSGIGRLTFAQTGLYANSWHDQNNRLEGSQSFRQVWYDEISVGTEFKDVDPDQ